MRGSEELIAILVFAAILGLPVVALAAALVALARTRRLGRAVEDLRRQLADLRPPASRPAEGGPGDGGDGRREA